MKMELCMTAIHDGQCSRRLLEAAEASGVDRLAAGGCSGKANQQRQAERQGTPVARALPSPAC
jgi:hypothetical protein